VETRPFHEKSTKPDAAKLKDSLGPSFRCYSELDKLSAAFKKEWNHSKMSGWMQKVSDSKKALYYIIPLENSFRVSLTIRENEREDFLEDITLSAVHALLNSARRFVEGYALQFTVVDRDSFLPLKALIQKLMATRTDPSVR
jgi:hypothetical protein